MAENARDTPDDVLLRAEELEARLVVIREEFWKLFDGLAEADRVPFFGVFGAIEEARGALHSGIHAAKKKRD